MEVEAREPRSTDHLTPNAHRRHRHVRPEGIARQPADSEHWPANRTFGAAYRRAQPSNRERRTVCLESGRRDPEPAMPVSARRAPRARTMAGQPDGKVTPVRTEAFGPRTSNRRRCTLTAPPRTGVGRLYHPVHAGPNPGRTCPEPRSVESERRSGDSPLETRHSEPRMRHLYARLGAIRAFDA